MLRMIRNRYKIITVIFFTIILMGCGGGSKDNKASNDIWDIDHNPLPKFVTTNYIELDKIYRISKFRSSVGHNYSDFVEDCRSMKHYFEPAADVDWSSVKIFAPVSGTITRVEEEAIGGTKLEIASDAYPAFRFSIFHINLSTPREINDKVTAGEQLGTHIGNQTYSDIAVIVNDTTRQGRMVSYFNVIDDNVFLQYVNYGINSRDDLIISKELRDTNPLTCDGETFTSMDNLESWVTLN